MNILKKLTIRNIKLNKKRTITTIIGITLSTALICATFGLVMSFRQSLINDSISSEGDYHVTFLNVPSEELKYIENNRNIESYFLTQNIGYSQLDNIQDDTKPYLHLMGFSDDALGNYGLKLLEGRMPENSTEVIITKSVLSKAKLEYKIGDTINLDIYKRISDGYELSQNNPYTEEEQLEFSYNENYTIVGILDTVNQEIESYDSPGYTIITKLDSTKIDNANISVKYKNIRETYNITNEINEDKNYTTQFNETLLRYSGVAKDDNMNEMIFGFAIIVSVIIIFSSVFVIKNSFKMMVTEKYKIYGMLSSIGATSKQIKKNVLYEGFILGIIGIPLGIIGSLLAVWILTIIVNSLIGQYLNTNFSFCFPPIIILIGIVLSSITIYLSAIMPAKKAAKISPIDAIRSNEDIKIKAKEVKTPKIIKKIFKIGGVISYKNLKRNRKKYRTTVISIVVSIIIFIPLSSMMKYVFDFGDIYYEDYNYNISVYSGSETNKEELYNSLRRLDNVDESCYYKRVLLVLDNRYFAEQEVDSDVIYYNRYIEMLTMEDQEYEKFLNEVGISKNQATKGAILIDEITSYNKTTKKYVKQNALLINEKETLEAQNVQEENTKTINIPIVKRTTEKPLGILNERLPVLIVSEEYFYSNFDTYDTTTLYINSKNPNELQKQLENRYQDLYVNNIEENIKEARAIRTVIYILCYGFIAVIILIGITNIFNTISTNMILRSKEFAMLKSIGMTKKEFNRMIKLESLFYGLKALIIGLPIGIALSYFFYRKASNLLTTVYELPYFEIILCILAVFIIVSITMKYSISKINKQNIIETIRNDNI